MYEHIEAETRQHGVLELGIVVHYDRHNAHVREEASCPTNHVLGINFSKLLLRQDLAADYPIIMKPFCPAKVAQEHRDPCRPHCYCLPG